MINKSKIDASDKYSPHCYVCGDTNKNNFYKDKNRRVGWGSRCKECNRKVSNIAKRIKRPVISPLKGNDKLRCFCCKKTKRVLEFYKSEWRQTGRSSACKKCYATRYKNKGEEIRLSRIKFTFGITKEQYYGLIKKQNNLCAICKLPELSKRFNYLAIDHDHQTDMIRGLLCCRCNRALGLFKDNIDNLKEAILYLSKTHTIIGKIKNKQK